MKIYPTFYEKFFKVLCLDICREKITNFSPTTCSDHIVLTTFVLAYTIHLRKKSFFLAG